MKRPILLVCAMITAMTLGGLAQENAPAAEAGKPDQIKRERPGRGPMTPEQRKAMMERRKAMMDKRLERIKEEDAALHKELVELREKDPKAFHARMREKMGWKNAPAAEAGKPGQIKRERPIRGPMTPEQRKAMEERRMERIKEKDEALHKELVELREKDPEAFRARMREMGRERARARRNAEKGQGQGQGKGPGQGQGKEPKAEKPAEAKADQ